MVKRFSTVVCFLLMAGFVFQVYGQGREDAISKLFKDRIELYFKFELKSPKDINLISHTISIDNIKGNEVFAYANKKEFGKFLDMGYTYIPLTPPSMENIPVMKNSVDLKSISDWDFYPTYTAYVDMMYQFQTDYPDLCQVFSIGQTTDGRELLFARISDNVGQEEGEPQFMYTGTIHGDETTGYILLLHLIDYLLSNYGTNADVTNLVNNLDIWINPASNPDGTYAGGNNTVYGATRYNANGVDMNRNYPDPAAGPHPDGEVWQPETVAFMALAEANHFSLSCNTHGGAEVCNYPWDTWSNLHADDSWWYYVCREYADTVHANAPSGYLNDFDNGVTNGYAWYTITGGRQDYMTYFHQDREFTLELSNTKTPPASQLPTFWNYNYRSLLNYMKETLYGISGTVTDASTGNPIMAEVYIENHDMDSSMVFSRESTGKYFRPVYAGTYDVTFSAYGYYPQTFQNVQVVNHQLTVLDVQLTGGDMIADFTANTTSIPVGSSVNFTDLTFGNPVSWEWTFEGGTPATSTLQNPSNINYTEAGSYDVTLTVSNGTNSQTIVKENYITVSVDFIMQNTTVTTCNGVFYDSGGSSGNYTNNEDYTMTFLPGQTGAKIICQFTSFNIEDETNCDYDWLKIYDADNSSGTLIGTYCGMNSPGTITATNSTGALTFVFHSDVSVTKSGWSANISCEGVVLPPVADFIADSTTITEGGSVQFTDLSVNNPESWQWLFDGGTPANSSEQNPSVTYNSPGTYSVALVVTNSAGNNTLVKDNYITVNPLTGISSHRDDGLVVFPNPSSTLFTVSSAEKIKSVSVINLIGSAVVFVAGNSEKITVDVARLPVGIYFLKINTLSGLFTKKIQISR